MLKLYINIEYVKDANNILSAKKFSLKCTVKNLHSENFKQSNVMEENKDKLQLNGEKLS